MLALTRKRDEAIIINGNIEIKVLGIQGDKVKLGISAPKDIAVHRKEVYIQIQEVNKESMVAEHTQLNHLYEMMKNHKKI